MYSVTVSTFSWNFDRKQLKSAILCPEKKGIKLYIHLQSVNLLEKASVWLISFVFFVLRVVASDNTTNVVLTFSSCPVASDITTHIVVTFSSCPVASDNTITIVLSFLSYPVASDNTTNIVLTFSSRSVASDDTTNFVVYRWIVYTCYFHNVLFLPQKIRKYYLIVKKIEI